MGITVGGALQAAMTALTLVLAWAAASLKSLGLRLLVAAPMFITFTVVDTSMRSLANLWTPFAHS